MTTEATYSIPLHMPLNEAWMKLRDLTQAPNYVPDLTGCELHPGPIDGIGASRRVFQKSGRWLDETVTSWQEGTGFVIRLHQGEKGAPGPFRTAHFRYQLTPKGDVTELTTSMSYDLRWGPLGRLLDKLLLKKALGKAVARIAKNQKKYYETGVPSNTALLEGNR